MRLRYLVLGFAIAAALAAPGALSAPQDDFEKVHDDFTGLDGSSANDIRSCRWTLAELNNARAIALEDSGQYATFIQELDLELGRSQSDYCAGVAPDPSGGSANPQADLELIFNDWRDDGKIIACRYSRQQLVSALNLSAEVADMDAYFPGFRDAVRLEKARIDRGECAGQAPVSSLAIVKVKAKSKVKKNEYVTIRNGGNEGVGLKGFTLRDKAGHRIKLPDYTLPAAGNLRVVTGCQKGRRGARRVGAKFFACKGRQLWDDKGDVVKIVDAKRQVVAQMGYGRFKGVPRF